MSDLFIWLGIVFCVSQSAMFSGLNLAVFSLNRLNLEVEVQQGNKTAQRVLNLREDSNFVLTTILWGNVGINVLLTMLSDSVLAGLAAFFFSTFAITIFGEIIPQAYFSRNALKMASLLSPALRFYQFILYPFARPSALMLDAWLGKEAIVYYREDELKEIIRHHLEAEESEMEHTEAVGALNFLTIDDLPVEEEGVPIDPKSIIQLPDQNGRLQFPDFKDSTQDPFLGQIEASGKPWVILTDNNNNPKLVMDVDGFIRHALFHPQQTKPARFCHKPIIVTDRKQSLGEVLMQLKLDKKAIDDEVISHDIILVWDDQPRVITGSDLLGRLLSGIASK